MRQLGRDQFRVALFEILGWISSVQGMVRTNGVINILPGEKTLIQGGGLQRVLQARHNVRRLKAVASSVNSARTFTSPRSKNRRAPSCSLRMPKMGSISPFRRAYKPRALSVVIQCRCWRSRASEGPIHNALPVWASLVQDSVRWACPAHRS